MLEYKDYRNRRSSRNMIKMHRILESQYDFWVNDPDSQIAVCGQRWNGRNHFYVQISKNSAYNYKKCNICWDTPIRKIKLEEVEI